MISKNCTHSQPNPCLTRKRRARRISPIRYPRITCCSIFSTNTSNGSIRITRTTRCSRINSTKVSASTNDVEVNRMDRLSDHFCLRSHSAGRIRESQARARSTSTGHATCSATATIERPHCPPATSSNDHDGHACLHRSFANVGIEQQPELRVSEDSSDDVQSRIEAKQ